MLLGRSQDAAKYPLQCSTAPTTKNYSIQNVSNAQVDKLFQTIYLGSAYGKEVWAQVKVP